MDTNGNVVSRTRYYPFGQTWTQESTSPTDKMFEGYTRHGSTSGTYYAGARFYSADLGRFLSQDPVAGSTANPQSLNPYAYVQNNPLTYTDPTGMCLTDFPRATQAGELRGCGLDQPFLGRSCDPIFGCGDAWMIFIGGTAEYGAAKSIAWGVGLGAAAACTFYCPHVDVDLDFGTMFSDGNDLEEQPVRNPVEELAEELLVARPGSGPNVIEIPTGNPFEVSGRVFGEMIEGATEHDSAYPGKMYEKPDGTRIGLKD